MAGPLNMNSFPINNVAAGNTPGSVATLAQAMPIGALIDFAGATAPAGWALCFGQAISRTTFATLFALIGTTYGAGDGSTTFNLPDARGRVSAGKDDMGGVAAGRLTAATIAGGGSAVGKVGGAEVHTLTAAQSPPLTYTSTVSDPLHSHPLSDAADHLFSVWSGSSGSHPSWDNEQTTNNNTVALGRPAATGITVATTSNAGGASHNNVQPTIIMNKIIRVSYDG